MSPFNGITGNHENLVVFFTNKYSRLNIIYIFTLKLCFRDDNNPPTPIVILYFNDPSIRSNICVGYKQRLPKRTVYFLQILIYLFLRNTISISKAQLWIFLLQSPKNNF